MEAWMLGCQWLAHLVGLVGGWLVRCLVAGWLPAWLAACLAARLVAWLCPWKLGDLKMRIINNNHRTMNNNLMINNNDYTINNNHIINNYYLITDKNRLLP